MATQIQSGGQALPNEPTFLHAGDFVDLESDPGERPMLDVPSMLPARDVRAPRVEGGLVLYLDFDGVLHHENVLWHPRRGAYAGPPGFALFEHAPQLAALLEPFPTVQIVLSTSWVRQYGCYGAAKKLPNSLRTRVVGATFHGEMDERVFGNKPRGRQVLEDVARRRPLAWFALDDVAEGWGEPASPCLVLTDECRGISAPGIADAVTSHLERLVRIQRQSAACSSSQMKLPDS